MSNYQVPELLRNFFSVVAGVIAAFAVLISLVAFLMFTGIIDWGFESITTGDDTTPKISFAFSVSIAALSGGYTTAKISTRSNWVHINLTAIIIFLLAFFTDEFDLGYHMYWKYAFLLLIIPFALLGGYLGLRSERMKWK